MRLTDADILAVIRDLGIATPAQIVAEIMARHPDQDRTPDRIKAMLPSLVRYHFIHYIERYGHRYYYLDGTTPDPPDNTPLRARVMDFLTANTGAEYSTRDIAVFIGSTYDYTIQLLRTTPGITRRKTNKGSYWGVTA